MLEKTEEFIEYRQLRNYPIDIFNEFIEILGEASVNKGEVEDKDQEKILAIAKKIQSYLQITSDTLKRNSAVGLRPPSYWKEVWNVTWSKNVAFSKCLGEFMQFVINNSIEDELGIEITSSKIRKTTFLEP